MQGNHDPNRTSWVFAFGAGSLSGAVLVLGVELMFLIMVGKWLWGMF